MFNLDINFLNDRPDLKPNKSRSGSRARTPAFAGDDKRPLYIGVAALVFFPALAGTLWGVLTLRTGDLEQQQVQLDSQLGNLELEKKNLESINKEIAAATEEMQALATVFNQIKPWSAMAQDIRDRLPANVQLVTIKQLEPKDRPTASTSQTSANGAAPAAEPQYVQIAGLANSFNDVNDFMLTLQQSNFLKSDMTRLIEATLGEEKTLQSLNLPGEERQGNRAQPPKLPRKVEFTIQAALSDVPASELIRELDRKGAVGLVSRIEALKEKGVLQAQPAKPSNQTTEKKGVTTP